MSDGEADQLVGKIQERYGIAGDEAERQVAEFERIIESFAPKTEVRRRGLPQTKMVFGQPSALVYVPGRHRQSSGSRRAVMLLCQVWAVGFVFDSLMLEDDFQPTFRLCVKVLDVQDVARLS